MSDIASEDGNPPQNPYTLECTHTFHEVCINSWFVESPACPVCRALPVRPVFGPTRTEFQAVHPEVAPPRSIQYFAVDITALMRLLDSIRTRRNESVNESSNNEEPNNDESSNEEDFVFPMDLPSDNNSDSESDADM